jgi:predicted transport protein/predicted RNase H-like HicB family nuclease
MKTERDHLLKANQAVGSLYENYKRAILEFGDDVRIKPVGRYIGYLRAGRRFANFHVHIDHMKIWLAVKPGALRDPRNRAHITQDWNTVWDVRSREDFQYIVGLIHQAYNRKSGGGATASNGHDEIAEMSTDYSAIIRKDAKWWIGWIQEIPGVNSQGRSRAELLDNLRSALKEALELNRADARKAAGQSFEVASISI